jgi:dephospho-CoA kinase
VGSANARQRRPGRLRVVLRVGLTGGIGGGKSTVAGRLAEHGAVIVDSDQLAREVVAPGSAGLAAVVEDFGAGILAPDGSLDRPALAKLVFNDDAARARLNAIVHPLVRARSAELVAAAPPEAVLVHDIPLLVENGLAPGFHLVIVVDAPVELRIQRLVGRGMPEDDARARIGAQASEEQRLAAADVLLDNSGWPDEVQAATDALWAERLVPFEANVRLHRGLRSQPLLVEPDPTWPRQAARLAARLSFAAGERLLRVDHVGSTAVPGLPAKDVIDLQLSVRSLADADAIRDALADAGFPWLPDLTFDDPKPSNPDPKVWEKRVHSSADPGRLANVHVRVAGSPGWRSTLLFRDWLCADEDAKAEYLAIKRASEQSHAGAQNSTGYTAAKVPWFYDAVVRAERWAETTQWTPPPVP